MTTREVSQALQPDTATGLSGNAVGCNWTPIPHCAGQPMTNETQKASDGLSLGEVCSARRSCARTRADVGCIGRVITFQRIAREMGINRKPAIFQPLGRCAAPATHRWPPTSAVSRLCRKHQFPAAAARRSPRLVTGPSQVGLDQLEQLSPSRVAHHPLTSEFSAHVAHHRSFSVGVVKQLKQLGATVPSFGVSSRRTAPSLRHHCSGNEVCMNS